MDSRRYEVRITPAALTEIDRLPHQQRERVERAIMSLGDNPRPVGCKKFRGMEDVYRVRVGNYRVLYRVKDNELIVLIITIGDRKDIYRH